MHQQPSATPASRPSPVEIGEVIRTAWPRVVATLVRRGGDLEQAEDAAQEAAVEALRRWPETGWPREPVAWLTTVATRRLIDHRRREWARPERERRSIRDQASAWSAPPPDLVVDEPHSRPADDDDLLRLLFLCCHPALGSDAQVALTLRSVAGLGTVEIARAFLVSESTMAQRLVRAKHKIRAAKIPFRLPGEETFDKRLESVRRVVYLVFNEGYCSSGPVDEGPIRVDLCESGIALARLLCELHPDSECLGLLALVLLLHSRRGTRTDPDGDLVLLDAQDRSAWDHALIGEALSHLDVIGAARRGRPDATPAGPYELQGRIAAVHACAPSAGSTDWAAIVSLYDELTRIAPTAVVRLNRVVAVAQADGPGAGADALSDLTATPDATLLSGYHLFHTTTAWILARQGDPDGAVEAYRRATDLTDNPAEVALIRRRLAALVDLADRAGPRGQA